jgi:hypothetical protein
MSDQDGAPGDSGTGREDAIFSELKRVVADSDPVPGQVLAAAIDSETWRRVDAELAELVYDSVVDAELVRNARGTRQLTFEAPELTVELEVRPAALDGQLVPPQPAQIELRHSEGNLTAVADRLGHFRVEHIPQGPVSLRCQPDGGSTPTVTSWVVI